MKKTAKRILAALTVLSMLFAFSLPVFAASGAKTDPYGFTWLDEHSGIWYFQSYVYNKSEKAYEIDDYAYLDGNKLYDEEGDLIISNAYAMDDDPDLNTKPTAGFEDGKFYFLNKNGDTCKMSKTTSTKYSLADTNAKYFTLDANGLISKVSSKSLSSLDFDSSYSRSSSSNSGSSSDENITGKSGDYVDTYAFEDDPTKIAYDAYEDNELLISIYCKNSNVWVETEELLLSETCAGAKFLGYSTDYLVVMYDLDGSLYFYEYDDFDTAYPISLGEEIVSYVKDNNGFIKSIKTTKKTYTLDSILEDVDWDDEDDEDAIEYVENSTSKSVAYDSDDDAIVTLKKTSNYLYWDGEKLSESYKATYFGITEEGTPVWINDDDELWYYTGTKEKRLETDVTLIRYDDDGFAYQYKKSSKTYTLDI